MNHSKQADLSVRPTIPNIVIQCETGGGFQIGWSDNALVFPSRRWAEAVASRTDQRYWTIEGELL